MLEILKEGSKGHPVISLQKKLKRLGFDIEPTGTFGSMTTEAAKLFQLSAGLNNDGIVGPQTWSVLLAKAYDFNVID